VGLLVAACTRDVQQQKIASRIADHVFFIFSECHFTAALCALQAMKELKP